VGATIAIIVLLPESISAIQAASRNRLQKSLNLALGSALASIGLTIPTIALFSVMRGTDLVLGIDTKESVLFLLSILVILTSLRTGKTTIVQGAVLVIIFFVYLFTLVAP
jgi:Ca2+:H+ antiporter